MVMPKNMTAYLRALAPCNFALKGSRQQLAVRFAVETLGPVGKLYLFVDLPGTASGLFAPLLFIRTSDLTMWFVFRAPYGIGWCRSNQA